MDRADSQPRPVHGVLGTAVATLGHLDPAIKSAPTFVEWFDHATVSVRSAAEQLEMKPIARHATGLAALSLTAPSGWAPLDPAAPPAGYTRS
jgi:hypothetical protein